MTTVCFNDMGSLKYYVTLRGGGGQRSVTHTFFVFFETLFEGKLLVTNQHKASKDTFFLINLIFQSNSGLKKQSSKIEKCHMGGQKRVKKVSRII
jgi:hypothetical protein